MPRPLLLLAAALFCVATGCTAEVSGQPAAPSTPPSSAPPPSRPREIRLDGVDPCSLLTAQQRKELGFTSEPRPAKVYIELFRTEVPTCTMIGYRPALGLGISTVTSVGIERWRQGDLAARIEPVTIAGFPALVATPTKYTTYCSVEVDVAAGQLLDVQVTDGGGKPPVSQDELCQQSSQVANAMLVTLLTR